MISAELTAIAEIYLEFDLFKYSYRIAAFIKYFSLVELA